MADLSDFIDQDDIDDYFASEDEAVIASKLATAQDAAEYARSIAPEDEGTYKDDINVHQAGERVWVGFDDDKSNLIEYGTIDTPAFAIRAKMESQFGGEFDT